MNSVLKEHKKTPAGTKRRRPAAVLLTVSVFLAAALTDTYYLKTGSMSPAYPTGSVIITSPLAKPKKGAVCAYMHNGMTVIHRITAETEEGYIFKGDANSAADPYTVIPEDIVGGMILGIPSLF